jgi:hypothetical protein
LGKRVGAKRNKNQGKNGVHDLLSNGP